MENNNYFEKGRELAETAWKEKEGLSVEGQIDLVRELRCKIRSEDIPSEAHNDMLDGMASFFTENGAGQLDRNAVNKDYKALYESGDYEGYIRIVDQLLPRLDSPFSERGDAIEIPAEIRPHLTYDTRDVEGVIGRMYLAEEGMHMYFPECDIYSEKNPDELIAEQVPLLYSKVVTSEVLTAIQAVVDPQHKNQELSDTIQKSLAIENSGDNPLYNFLQRHGIVALSIKEGGRRPRYCEDIYGDIVNVILDRYGVYADVEVQSGEEYYECEILPSINNYHWMLDDIKRAINVAIGKYHK